MRHLPVEPRQAKGDPKLASAKWKEVIAHLEAARSSFREKKVSETEIEWAIQNARVVLQTMQMRANEITRDHSMATNVKWILNQSPKAKIVLWAHNGHVSTSKFRGYEPMGTMLRRMYGDSMVVFGFAFNQGSFQAVEAGKALRNFTVPSAPAGSLDEVFSAAGIPRPCFGSSPGPEERHCGRVDITTSQVPEHRRRFLRRLAHRLHVGSASARKFRRDALRRQDHRGAKSSRTDSAGPRHNSRWFHGVCRPGLERRARAACRLVDPRHQSLG
jgi:erythromycin esterase-like protein